MTVDDERVPALLGSFGAVVVLGIAGEFVVATSTAAETNSLWTPGVIMSVPVAAGLVYSGYYLATSSIPIDRYRRVLGWCFGGVGVFLAVNAATMVVIPPPTVFSFVSWIRWAGALGAGAGTAVGIVEARAVSIERQSIREEEAQTREELLNYLNATLRHEVLNSASAILAHVELLRDDDLDAETCEKLGVIERQAEGMTTVIEDVRVLLQVSRSTNGSNPVDVTEMLATETAALSRQYGRVTVETSMPEQAVVSADPMVRRAFANVLNNAVEHNDGESAAIDVTVERYSETVGIEISDDGPGVSDAEREHLFEREVRDDANHGLGLALTDTLVKSYDGRIELADTGPEGTTFRIELPRAETAEDSATSAEPSEMKLSAS